VLILFVVQKFVPFSKQALKHGANFIRNLKVSSVSKTSTTLQHGEKCGNSSPRAGFSRL
jgi:hypothetical protein